ncbi:MAG: OmpA family protein, partial [Bacteroidales bacterium]|nr:OmpA family protein [Bacteroidales bacterium]
LTPYLREMERGEAPVGAPVYVFFRLAGSYVTDTPQLLNINAAADLAAARGLHVRITGAADSATGTTDKNAALATARAEHVAKLMKKRGLPEERIEVRSEGGITTYEPITANRNCRIELFTGGEVVHQ